MTTIYTIGHSTRSIEEFIGLLKQQSITQLVDIRTIPKSRHNPQFGQDELSSSLEKVNIKYLYLESLGGLRPPVKNSVNLGWHNQSFRNYADYMQTSQFIDGLNQLIGVAKDGVTAIMCAEAVPWRCHRSLVSDALMARGIKVLEIISENSLRQHQITKFAKIDGLKITYPSDDQGSSSSQGSQSLADNDSASN